jgi:cysteine-rich repeat protein
MRQAWSQACGPASLIACLALVTSCQLLGGFEDFNGIADDAGIGGVGPSGNGGSGGALSNPGGGKSGGSAGGSNSEGGGGQGGVGGSSDAGEGGTPSNGGAGGTAAGKGGVAGVAGTLNVAGTGQGGRAGAGSGGQGGAGGTGTAPKCGNGLVEKGEVCDDGNASACGQCNGNCTSLVQPAVATGSIQVEAGIFPNFLHDGDTFTLNDGVHPAVIFEFDNKASPGVAAGHVAVPFTPQDAETTLANEIFTAINTVAKKAPPTLYVIPKYISQRTELTYSYASSLGNKPITSTVNGNVLILDGMSGGLAGDCASGVGCEYPGDCAPGLSCVTEKCAVSP